MQLVFVLEDGRLDQTLVRVGLARYSASRITDRPDRRPDDRFVRHDRTSRTSKRATDRAGLPDPKSGPMTSLEGVSKVYRTDRIETLALDGVSLTLGAGEFISSSGLRGAGRARSSTLSGCWTPPRRGAVLLDGAPVRPTTTDRSRGYETRRSASFPVVSSDRRPDIDNVELPLLYRSMAAAERDGAPSAALEVGLSSRVHHFPGSSPAGSNNASRSLERSWESPRCSSPTSPPETSTARWTDEIVAKLDGINRNAGTTIAMVTHDPRD